MRHILSVTVQDEPGVLAKISSICAMRGFNIRSLAVGPMHTPGLSRITLVVDDVEVEQIAKQLHKVISVLKITELEPGTSLETEVLLVRVAVGPDNRREVRDAAEVFGATTLDVGAASLTFSLAAHPERLADFVQLMEGYGVLDLVKSGRIAMARDQKSPARLAAKGARA